MTPTLPLDVGQRPQGLDGGVGVAHELVVGDAAGLAGGRRGVVGIDIEALAGVEVGADGVVAVGGEAPGDLLGPRVPAGQVVDDEDPGKGPVAGGQGLVGVDLGALVAGEDDVPGAERLFGCGHGGLLSFSFACGAVPCDVVCLVRRAVRRHYGAPAPGPVAAATGMMCAVRRLVRGPGRARLARRGGGRWRSPSARPRGGRRARRGAHRARPRACSTRPGGIALDAAGRPLRRRHRPLPGRRRAAPAAAPSTGCTCGRARAATLAGGSCTGRGSIGHPTAVAVDVHGDVYVAEATAQRVQELRAGSRHRR